MIITVYLLCVLYWCFFVFLVDTQHERRRRKSCQLDIDVPLCMLTWGDFKFVGSLSFNFLSLSLLLFLSLSLSLTSLSFSLSLSLTSLSFSFSLSLLLLFLFLSLFYFSFSLFLSFREHSVASYSLSMETKRRGRFEKQFYTFFVCIFCLRPV